MKKLFMISTLLLMGTSVLANEQLKADRAAVNESCKAEGVTAGCGENKVGTGLLKCIHKYRKEHKEFKVSQVCKASMRKLHLDRRALKETREK
jgi:hypothetical protein